MDIIGKNLLMLREGLDLLQSEASNGIVSRDYISKMESGSISSASQKVIISLAKKLSTTEGWLTKNTGWAYDPPTTLKAVSFIARQIEKFKPTAMVIITYSDENFGKPNGFVFIRSDGLISMAGSQTRSGYHGKGPASYRQALELIREAKIKVGRIEVNRKESEYLIYADLSVLIKKAMYDKNVIEKELQALRPDLYQESDATLSNKDSSIVFTEDEKTLINVVRKSKMDINDLISFIKKIPSNK